MAQGACAFDDRFGRDQCLIASGTANQAVPGGGPSRPGQAARADESDGPSRLSYVCATGLRGGESLLEFGLCQGGISPHEPSHNIA